MMPKGLVEVTATFCFLWPLLPLLLNSRNTVTDAKIESIMAHVLGQTSNFGIAELLRTQIQYPEDLFLEKCNISPSQCLRLSHDKNPLQLYASPQINIQEDQSIMTEGLCKGQFYHTNDSKILNDNQGIIYNSLHHYPDVVCMLLERAL